MSDKPKKYITIKIYRTTHPLLRQLAANTGEKLSGLVDRLVKQEEQRRQEAAAREGK